MSRQATVYALGDLVGFIADEHQAADDAIAEGRQLGPLVEFPLLATELGGWWPRGVVALHAAPGAGKSAFGDQAALHAGCPSIILSCEMGASTTLRRLIACDTGDYLGRLRVGTASASTIRAKAIALALQHPHFGIIDATTAPCTPAQLIETILAMRECGDHVTLIVDSLNAWARATWPEHDEYPAVSAAMETLRQLAEQHACSVIAIVERNRASMAAGGLSAGAGSRTIEYSCEAMIEMQAVGPTTYPGMVDPVQIQLKFSKNRNGRAGVTIDYAFEAASLRFAELSVLSAAQPIAATARPTSAGYEDADLFGALP